MATPNGRGEGIRAMSINPIFQKRAPASPKKNHPPMTPRLNSGPAVDRSTVPTSPKRKTRSDKTHDIRICVTLNQKALIRRLAKESKVAATKYATRMLLDAISSCRALPAYEYRDTKIYVHVKPAQLDYQKVFEFAIANDVSEREAATRLVMHVLRQRGGLM